MSKDKIKLFKSQESHVDSLVKILSKFSIAFDFSMLGTGKTYTSSYISELELFNFKYVIVICPLSVIPKWTYMSEKYGIKIEKCITYTSVRSTKGRQPDHGYLSREDLISEKVSMEKVLLEEKTYFKISKDYKKKVEEGTLLIIDEIQNIKNENTQFKGCKELLSEIIGDNLSIKNKSRCILLSGSPIDKQEQVITLFNLLGIIKEKELVIYIPSLKKYEWRGFKEIIEVISSINGKKYLNIEKELGQQSIDKFIGYVYNLFQNDLKYLVSSSMPPLTLSQSDNISLIKRNAFYNIEDKDRDNLRIAVSKLSNYKIMELSSVKEQNFIQCVLMEIELLKLATIERIIKEHLSTPNEKVVLCLNYKNSVKILTEKLKDFSPLILTGETSLPERSKNISRFQEPNLNNRLLIANLNVCSTGIDLDDKNGNFPRFCLVNPSYSTISQYQLCHRFYRQDTRSTAVIHFIYGKHAYELAILNSLSEKSRVIKDTVNEQSKNEITFQCDYINYIED